MLFNTIQFALFFLLVLGVYRVCGQAGRTRWLIACSLVFYALWIPSYVILLLVDLSVNYGFIRAMRNSPRPRLHLIASITFSLGVLAYFKYAAFFIESLHPLLGGVLGLDIEVPEILLPLGISFFTFQLLGLAIDAYRGEIEAPQHFSEYLLFVSFFPQLIAGPILRGRELLPQLRRGGEITRERSRRGLWLIASGLAKKAILADLLLAPFANEVFSSPGSESAAFHLIATYSFAFQIYFDFSGYSDIARGLALLLGFELPFNFREPYLSRSPSEFWERWHITLSSWLRDYVYIPLGGNRVGRARVFANLMITMLLGGLWHGAAWTFVIWGGLHGAILVVGRLLGRAGRSRSGPIGVRDWPSIFFCFHGVCALWIFFRADNLEGALSFFAALTQFDGYGAWPLAQTAIVLACGAAHVLERTAVTRLAAIRAALGGRVGAIAEGAVFGVVIGLWLVSSGHGGEFIYFQF